MNLRSWNKHHTIGLLIGILTILAAIPLVMYILSLTDNREFSTVWTRFNILNSEKSRIISLASIANLIWFHTFMRKEKYAMGMGIIVATILSLLVMVYFKFIA
ncbi:MAG: hypothetical protein EP338_02760 [Bacteroidetes bacterium]|nr:MAG: hypothetical protein EP338_02760 [Bacteroidota bacterium]